MPGSQKNFAIARCSLTDKTLLAGGSNLSLSQWFRSPSPIFIEGEIDWVMLIIELKIHRQRLV